MNILHMKYATEVARLGSLNKAAEALFIAQPNISRAIKDLETEIGITIFNRSSKGMFLTSEGEEFISYARDILRLMDELDGRYKGQHTQKQRFSVSVPKTTCYISEAFAEFSKCLSDAPAEVFFREAELQKTVADVTSGEYKLGIVRYEKNDDKLVKTMLEEKGLVYEMLAEFSCVAVMSKFHALAKKEEISLKELSCFLEVVSADENASPSRFSRDSFSEEAVRHVFAIGQENLYSLLSENTETFALLPSISEKVAKRYSLVQKKTEDGGRTYKDLLLYREGYRLSSLDKQFITELCESRRNCFR